MVDILYSPLSNLSQRRGPGQLLLALSSGFQGTGHRNHLEENSRHDPQQLRADRQSAAA